MQTRSQTRWAESLVGELLKALPSPSYGDFLLLLTPTRWYNVTREDDGSYAWEYRSPDGKQSTVHWSNEADMIKVLTSEKIQCYELEAGEKSQLAASYVEGKSPCDLVKAFYKS